jgi:methyltransferase-like protein/predicted O-methyltransferase YrrM
MTLTPPYTSFDEIPYPNLSHVQTHPDRLATMATLLGLNTPPIERCRVLELGCAIGGNIIPMAYSLPESEFVGIDNSRRQIAIGQAALQSLALKNVVLEQRDILDVDGGLGRFDYIIAHGFLSWVPRPVQDKLFEICQQLLAPNGVAYASYNTYPGGHMVHMLRDMMCYHTRSLDDPRERARQARDFLNFVAETLPDTDDAYVVHVKKYAQSLQGESKDRPVKGDSALLHDELAEFNEPFYFYQFAERAASYGLQYLGEADFHSMTDRSVALQASEKLRQMTDSVIELEQYLDFLRNRTFRRTLLCREGIPVERQPTPDRLRNLYFASQARPEASESDPRAGVVTKFEAPDGAVLFLSQKRPVTKEAMHYLVERWPQAIPFDALLRIARARVGAPPDAAASARDARALSEHLLAGYHYSANLVEPHSYAPPIVVEVSERPVASAVARFQAQRYPQVTNLRHERASLDAFNRCLLPYLDGSRDHAALADALLAGPLADGRLVVRQDDEATPSAGEVRHILVEQLERRLHQLARSALLIG